MNNKISLDSMIHLAVNELDERQYEAYIAAKTANTLKQPGENLDNRIQRIIHKRDRKDKYIYFGKVMSKVAVCFMILFTCTSFTFLTAEAVRESVAMVAMEWYEKFTRTTISADNPPAELPEIELGYIPEGFVTEEHSYSIDEYYHKFIYNKDGLLEITIVIADSNIGFNFDNERLEYYIVKMGNENILWFNNDNYNHILISEKGLTFDLKGDFPLNELVEVHRNIGLK